MKYKMIIMDMDGTLLNSEGVIPSKTKEKLISLEKEGVVVVLASGRSWKTLESFGKELEMGTYQGWFIGANGTALTEVKGMKHTVLGQVSPSEIKEIFEVAKPYEVEIMGVQDATIFDYIPDSLREIKRQYRIENKIAEDVPWTGGVFNLIADQRKGYSTIHDLKDVEGFTESVNKMTFCHQEEVLKAAFEALTDKLGDRYNFMRTSHTWLECTPKSISKGNAIRKLQKMLNISKEETVIFGDGENDLSMFDCGFAVAMGNAMETVKQAADAITADNNHDGIAEFLDRN